jgi:hypothetical protein
MLAHAATYVGYNASNQGASTCGVNCDTNGNNANVGIGETIQSPLTGQLAQVGFMTGSQVPTKVVVLTFPTTSQMSGSSYSCGSAGTCGRISSGLTFTVADVEVLSGLAGSTFYTISLSNPVSVTQNQWIAIVFLSTASNNGYLMAVSANGNANVLDTLFNFGTVNPSGNYNSAVGNIADIVGGSFQGQASLSGITQCYGNCGSPAITLTNSNATKTVAFNQSITLFYDFQSQLNGFFLNVTANLGIAAASSQQIFIGIYTVDVACPITSAPFGPNCPGSLKQATSYGGQTPKGRIFMKATPNQFTIQNGEWIGISISATLSGVSLNSTNTTCAASFACNTGLFYTGGNTPQTITSSASCDTPGPCSIAGIDNLGLWTWIQGTQVGTPNTPPTSSCTNNFAQLDCLLPAMSNGLCNVLTASCQTSASLFWVIMLALLGFLVATVGMSSAHVTRFVGAGELFLFLFMAWFFIFAGIGLIESFVIIFFLFIGAAVFGKTARNYF